MKPIIFNLALTTFALFFGFEAGAKPVPKLPVKAKLDDEAALQGEWEVISQHPALLGLKLIVKGNTWTPPSSKMKFTFHLNATKSPKEFDLISETGGVWHGIYKIEGATFTFCRSMGADAERPTEFDGTAAFLLVCKRVT